MGWEITDLRWPSSSWWINGQGCIIISLSTLYFTIVFCIPLYTVPKCVQAAFFLLFKAVMCPSYVSTAHRNNCQCRGFRRVPSSSICLSVDYSMWWHGTWHLSTFMLVFMKLFWFQRAMLVHGPEAIKISRRWLRKLLPQNWNRESILERKSTLSIWHVHWKQEHRFKLTLAHHTNERYFDRL